MKQLRFIVILLGILLAVRSHSQDTETSIYFVSNINDKVVESILFDQLKSQLQSGSHEKILVFLGGYHSKDADEDGRQMAFLEDLPKEENIKYVFLPGYEEWDRNNSSPEKTILELNSEISETLEEESHVISSGACPGPFVVEIDDSNVLMLFSDYWLLNDFDVPKIEEGCIYPRKLDFLLELKEQISRYSEKRIILAAINPLESSGPVGGKYKLKHHLFPLTIKSEKKLIPLPVIGSFYLAYRKLIGNPDDLSNLKNRYLRKYLMNILSDSLDLVYVSANENHLDYRKVDGMDQVIIGALQGSSYSKSEKAQFNSTENGYAGLEIAGDGSLELQFYTSSETPYKRKIFEPISKKNPEKPKTHVDYADSSITAVADFSLRKPGKRKPGLTGINYRREWVTPLQDVPYFNWGKEYGGLKIVKKGGGMQTRSLRLENADEKQYVLRSIRKYPENAIPAEIRGTIFAELVNDQISASHPYAAYAIPKLADAAGVYHTNPKLVYLNDDPRLGKYSHDFAGGLYLYEERPADEREDVKSFGSPRDIESTLDIVEKTQKSGKHQIDQYWVLKSRLFDIWIGDWDRHDDQWRWAEFKTDKDHKFYRPIPRDRDQAFFYSDGLILNLASRKWGIPKFQGFDHTIRDVNGLSFNARYFDRYFLNEPDLDDWLASADTLQSKLSDDVIEQGVRDLPDEIFEINGEVIISKLKSRRADLKDYAEKYHRFLSRNVNVLGTNKANRFDVYRLENGNTKVEVYEVGKNSRDEKYNLYSREFDKDITREIRLYGLKGKDEFNISGEARKGIKVRIIGGGGKDVINDNSRVKGLAKKTIVYDKKKSTELNAGAETKNRLSNSDDVNEYNRNEFKYERLMPFLFVNYNPDDGVFIGGGPVFTSHGFRKDPFKSSHKLLANIAPKSANYNISYSGIFTDVIGRLDSRIDALISTPSFSTFYYGLGNNTILSKDRLDEDNQYYRVRFDTEILKISLIADSRNDKHKFSFGPNYLRANIRSELNEDEDDDPRFLIDLATDSTTLEVDLLNDFRFIGLHTEYEFNSRNNSRIPERGMYFKTGASYLHDAMNSKYNSVRLEASEAIYLTLSHRIKTILAIRAGGAAIIGDYPFFLAPSIGGLQTMRGFRRNRFRGDYSFYQNTELRIRLFTIRSEFLIADFGVLGFHDTGRIWMEDPVVQNSIYSDQERAEFRTANNWHRGAGFGLWLAPFNMAVLSADYSFGNDDGTTLFVRLGFLF